MREINGYVWKLEDTPAFVAGRVEEARREYLAPLLPPFFDALVRFTQEARYSWHTPGHSGGTAFLKTPVGSAFHEFFGENTLRSDLSVSVGELGSLLEHTGPIGEAETQAARIFGADRTHVRHQRHLDRQQDRLSRLRAYGRHRAGRPQLPQVDHARDRDDRRDPRVPAPDAQRLRDHRTDPAGRAECRDGAREHGRQPAGHLEDDDRARLAVVTNSTYDGLCYDADGVLAALADSTERVLFDEAWFAYAHFHPLYSRATQPASRAGRDSRRRSLRSPRTSCSPRSRRPR